MNINIDVTQFAGVLSNTALVTYSAEIMPRIRDLEAKKQELKDYKEGNEAVVALQQSIKDAQEALALHLETEDTVKELLNDIREMSKELTLALKAASKGVGKKWKPKELKAYFFARAKDKVKPTVDKGELFSEIDSVIAEDASVAQFEPQ